MKKAVLMVVCLCVATLPAFAQWRMDDYKDGATVKVDTITYRIKNNYEEEMKDDLFREKGVCITMEDVNNHRLGGSQYADGSPVVYTEHAPEVSGIILPKSYYHKAIYQAVRSAFSKEKELIPYANESIFIYISVDNQGNILETCCSFFVWEAHTFQPEQIATLESLIRKNLKFEVSPKAKNFNYFEGQIIIPFGRYIEDMPEIKIKEGAKAFDEEGEDIPSLGEGSLIGASKIGGGNCPPAC